MVKHKNRFWANGANKSQELWKFYFFLACLLSFLVESMIPLPNLVWEVGGFGKTYFRVKIVIPLLNLVWGGGGFA